MTLPEDITYCWCEDPSACKHPDCARNLERLNGIECIISISDLSFDCDTYYLPDERSE